VLAIRDHYGAGWWLLAVTGGGSIGECGR